MAHLRSGRCVHRRRRPSDPAPVRAVLRCANPREAASHRRIRIAPHPARARTFVGVRSTRSSSNSLVLCSGSKKKRSRRCAASTRHWAWAACDRAWRKYSCGHPNTPRGAGSSAYFQDVAHGHLCVQSRSHFSLRLAAFDAWLGSLDDGISVNIACCRSSIACLCTGAFAGRSSGPRTPSKHPAASR